MLSGEATNTNFIVFGLTQPGLEATIYCTRGEHANHYSTDVAKRVFEGLGLGLWCLAEVSLKSIEREGMSPCF